jgi:hypothetical protein
LVHPTISQHDHFLTLKKKCKGSKKQNKTKSLSQKILKEKSKISQGHFKTIRISSLMATMSRTKRTRNPTKRNPGIGTSSMIIYVTNKKKSESFMAIIQEISMPTKQAVMAIP